MVLISLRTKLRQWLRKKRVDYCQVLVLLLRLQALRVRWVRVIQQAHSQQAETLEVFLLFKVMMTKTFIAFVEIARFIFKLIKKLEQIKVKQNGIY